MELPSIDDLVRMGSGSAAPSAEQAGAQAFQASQSPYPDPALISEPPGTPTGPGIAQSVAAASAPPPDSRGGKGGGKEPPGEKEILDKLIKDMGSTKKSFGPDMFDSKLGGILGSGISPMSAILFGIGGLATRNAPKKLAWDVSMKLMGLPQEYEAAQNQVAQSKVQQAIGLLKVGQEKSETQLKEQQAAEAEKSRVAGQALVDQGKLTPHSFDPVTGKVIYQESQKLDLDTSKAILRSIGVAEDKLEQSAQGLMIAPKDIRDNILQLAAGAKAQGQANSFEGLLSRQLGPNATQEQILEASRLLQGTRPAGMGGAERQMFEIVKKVQEGTATNEEIAILKEWPKTLEGLRQAGATGAGRGNQLGALEVRQGPGYIQNQTDISSARTAGQPIPESADTAITSMRTMLTQLDRVNPSAKARAAGSLYDPAYVGPIASGQGWLKEKFGQTPVVGGLVGGPAGEREIQFRAVMNNIFNEVANLRGGKVLPPNELHRIEQEVGLLSNSPASFEARYPAFRNMVETLLKNRIEGVGTTRGTVGQIGQQPTAGGGGKPLPMSVAQELFKASGGDWQKATAEAIKRGYNPNNPVK